MAAAMKGQTGRGAGEQAEGKGRVNDGKERLKTTCKVLMDSHSARVGLFQRSGPSRVYKSAQVASLYHPYQWPEGGVKPLAGESSASIQSSEMESARRTYPCCHVSSCPSQLYRIVPTATCRTILPTIQGLESVLKVTVTVFAFNRK